MEHASIAASEPRAKQHRDAELVPVHRRKPAAITAAYLSKLLGAGQAWLQVKN
jgi:hypothetical protein